VTSLLIAGPLQSFDHISQVAPIAHAHLIHYSVDSLHILLHVTLRRTMHSPSKNLPLPVGSGSPSNKWYLGPTRPTTSNSIWIGSAVFPQYTLVANGQTDQQNGDGARPVRIGLYRPLLLYVQRGQIIIVVIRHRQHFRHKQVIIIYSVIGLNDRWNRQLSYITLCILQSKNSVSPTATWLWASATANTRRR